LEQMLGENKCLCGCGQRPTRGKLFMPGHDSRMPSPWNSPYDTVAAD
jgi:hypothetical protein